MGPLTIAERDHARAARWVVAALASGLVLAPIMVLASDSPWGVAWPLVIEFASLAVFLVAALKMPPGARVVWWALWATQLLTVAGDCVYDYQQYHLGEVPFPGLADPLYLASYLPEIGALIILVHTRHPAPDREQWLDSAIISVPIAAVVATFVLLPMLSGQELDAATLVGIAYPVLDTIVLVGLIRLLVGGGRPNAALGLVTASVALTLMADLTYNALASEGLIDETPGWMQVLFSLGVILMTAAAVSGSAATVHEPAPDSDRVMSISRAVALGLGTLTLPALLVIGARADVDSGIRILALASFAVNLLVLWRALLLLRVVQRQRRDLSQLARTDSLTGLPNRRSWDHELQRVATWARTTGSPLIIAMVDIDHFKAFNDRHGHQAGDRLLAECAHAWTAALPAQAYLARYGGDEFALLLPGVEPDEAQPTLEAMRRSTPSETSASVGFAPHNRDSDVLETVADADTALYAAKARGRSQVATLAEAMADQRT